MIPQRQGALSNRVRSGWWEGRWNERDADGAGVGGPESPLPCAGPAAREAIRTNRARGRAEGKIYRDRVALKSRLCRDAIAGLDGNSANGLGKRASKWIHRLLNFTWPHETFHIIDAVPLV